MEVVNCFLEADGKILVVERYNAKAQGQVWDLPADKVGDSESREEAIARVVAKEAGYKISSKTLVPVGTFQFVSSMGEPYTMFTYRIKLSKPFSANSGTLKSEWATPRELLTRKNLIKNLAELLKQVGYVD